MFVDDDTLGALQQGDIIKNVPIPYLQDSNEKIVFIGKGGTKPENWEDWASTPPTSTVCDDARDKAIFIPTLTRHVLVLSQTCDLARIAEGEEGRIIVAPLVAEAEDKQITEQVRKKRAKMSERAPGELMAALTSGDQNAASKFEKTRESMDAARDEHLKNIWLGHVDGVFPVAQKQVGELVLQRSVCYFENVVSLPKSWYKLLEQRRVLRIEQHWRAVLQEQLANYFGRFAFPGTNEERIRVGGLGEDT